MSGVAGPWQFKGADLTPQPGAVHYKPLNTRANQEVEMLLIYFTISSIAAQSRMQALSHSHQQLVLQFLIVLPICLDLDFSLRSILFHVLF